MNVLALCAGVGGLELGLKLAVPSSRAVCFVEGEAYAAAVLAARMEEGHLAQAPIWSDLRTFDARPWRGVVDCVTGGYPCQPFSSAGKRRGADDPRHLWPHVLRVLVESGASVGFFENVQGHVSKGLREVLQDLAGVGFHAEWDLFSAEEEGAPHVRKRLFILAYSDRDAIHFQQGRERPEGPEGLVEKWPRASDAIRNGENGVVADANCERLEAWREGRQAAPPGWTESDGQRWWSAEPGMGRVADGTPDRVDRLRACGNGVVPLCAARAWRELSERTQ